MMALAIGACVRSGLAGKGPLFERGIMMRRYSLTLLAAAAVALAASQTASAADLGPVRRAPPAAPAFVPPPVFNWTGFYIGGNLGVAWTEGDVTDNFGNSFHNSQQAVFTGGGQVGANYQWNWLVVGVEGDFDWLANNHNSSNTLTNVTTGGSISVSNSNSNDGPVGGVGVEWAFAPNWTAKLEYDRLFLNDRNFTGVFGENINISNRDVQTVTVGVNYLFNWGHY
jgi:outer membrane immunogenic protein